MDDDTLTFEELLTAIAAADPAPAGEWLATAHGPGSPGKIEVLRARAAARQPLFHPGDAVDCSTCTKRRRELALQSAPRTPQPATQGRLAFVADGLRFGVSYRKMAVSIGCALGTVQKLVAMVRAEGGAS